MRLQCDAVMLCRAFQQVTNYSGVRISSSRRQFRIEGATVWTMESGGGKCQLCPLSSTSILVNARRIVLVMVLVLCPLRRALCFMLTCAILMTINNEGQVAIFDRVVRLNEDGSDDQSVVDSLISSLRPK